MQTAGVRFGSVKAGR